MIEPRIFGNEEISDWVKKSQAVHSIVQLPGDASTRKYYRIASERRSYIVMKMEPFSEQSTSLPFLAVQKHLFQAGVAVPEVLDVSADQGFILLEDLGDTTLLRKFQNVTTSDTERHLYEKAIDLLVHFQAKASPQVLQNSKDPALEAFHLKFDHEKLMWEVDFAIDNFYRIYLNRKFIEEDLAFIRDGFSEICAFLAEQETVLTHRDFHTRNIMLTPTPDGGERFVMIDFQDARMGPPQYDLASLLKDSYYQLDENQISGLIDYYIARYEAVVQKPIDHLQFKYVFDLMSIQRNFKAIGSFASFLNRRGDASYLKFIGNTFENIRRALLKYPKYSRLRELLFHYYYF